MNEAGNSPGDGSDGETASKRAGVSHDGKQVMPKNTMQRAYIDIVKSQFFFLGLSSGASLQ